MTTFAHLMAQLVRGAVTIHVFLLVWPSSLGLSGSILRQLGDKIRVGPPDLTPEFNNCSNLHDLMLDEGYLNAKLFMFAPRFIVEGTKGDKLRSRQDCREEIDTTAP